MRRSGEGATIGPFARIRGGAELGQDVHLGNFVEVKKSKIGAGTKAGHLSYLGDAEIGARPISAPARSPAIMTA